MAESKTTSAAGKSRTGEIVAWTFVGIGILGFIGLIIWLVLCWKKKKTPADKQQQQQTQTPPQQQKQQQKQEGGPHLNSAEEFKKLQASGEAAVIMVYADWCGWSKKTLPAFREAAKKSPVAFFLVKENVKIPGLEVRGYPTIFRVKGTDKVELKGGKRGAEDLLKFAQG